MRARPKVMSLTERAAERVAALTARSSGMVGVRVGVKNGGCAGMEYTLDYATERAPHDEVIEEKGAVVLIDPKAILFLLGTEMDYEETTLRSGFVFHNPNVTDACGCGESVTIQPAKDYRSAENSADKSA